MQAIASTPTQVAEEMLALWKHLMRDSRGVYAVLEELDVSLTQMKSCHTLAMAEEPRTVKELSEDLGLSLPAVSRIVDAMVRRGWMERREDEVDRRMKRITLSDQGRVALDRIDAARLAGVQAWMSDLPEAQRAALSAALRPILEDLR